MGTTTTGTDCNRLAVTAATMLCMHAGLHTLMHVHAGLRMLLSAGLHTSGMTMSRTAVSTTHSCITGDPSALNGYAVN